MTRLVLFLAFFAFSGHAIVDGSEDINGEFKNVFQFELEVKGRKYLPCTATVISDYAILTAGHCFDNIPFKLYEGWFGRKRNPSIVINGYKLKVTDILYPEGYKELRDEYYSVQDQLSKLKSELEAKGSKLIKENELGKVRELFDKLHLDRTQSDLAIIKTLYKIPQKMRRTSLDFSDSKISVASVGYGLTDTTVSHLDIANYPEKPFYIKDLSAQYLNDRIEVSRYHNKICHNSITTIGDSGSPLLNSEGKQVGVLRGIYQTPNDGIKSIYTPISLHKDFILSNL